MSVTDSSPDHQVRQLDALLRRQLELPSPLEEAVRLMDGAGKLNFKAEVMASKARDERLALVRGLALGEIAFDDHSVAEFDTLSWYLPTIDQPTPVAVELVKHIRSQAAREAHNSLNQSAGPIWHTLVTEMGKVIGQLEALPKPPRNLFVHADPIDQLARTKGHEGTLSILIAASSRFADLHRAAEYVRDLSGNGTERFPDGAPASAATYRNWRKSIANDGQLRTIGKHVRLWWTVLNDWQPGLWTPEDIDRPTEQENSFAGRMARFGHATIKASAMPGAN
jgi:hypothetical protein